MSTGTDVGGHLRSEIEEHLRRLGADGRRASHLPDLGAPVSSGRTQQLRLTSLTALPKCFVTVIPSQTFIPSERAPVPDWDGSFYTAASPNTGLLEVSALIDDAHEPRYQNWGTRVDAQFAVELTNVPFDGSILVQAFPRVTGMVYVKAPNYDSAFSGAYAYIGFGVTSDTDEYGGSDARKLTSVASFGQEDVQRRTVDEVFHLRANAQVTKGDTVRAVVALSGTSFMETSDTQAIAWPHGGISIFDFDQRRLPYSDGGAMVQQMVFSDGACSVIVNPSA